MNSLRHGLLALLVLLQLLAPYLHTHASASAAGGLHVHLPSAAGPLAAATGQHISAPDAPRAQQELAVAQRHAVDSAGESPAVEMPVEWRRDQPVPVFADGALLPPAPAPPSPQRALEPPPLLVEAPPSKRPFAVRAYPAAAPPPVPARC